MSKKQPLRWSTNPGSGSPVVRTSEEHGETTARAIKEGIARYRYRGDERWDFIAERIVKALESAFEAGIATGRAQERVVFKEELHRKAKQLMHVSPATCPFCRGTGGGSYGGECRECHSTGHVQYPTLALAWEVETARGGEGER